MNFYIISQSENVKPGSYLMAVVVARDEEAARRIHPSKCGSAVSAEVWMLWDRRSYTDQCPWAFSLEGVNVRLIATDMEDRYNQPTVIQSCKIPENIGTERDD